MARSCFGNSFLSLVMKNKVLCFLQEEEREMDEQGLVELRLLARELNHFNKVYKKKNKKSEEKEKRKRCN